MNRLFMKKIFLLVFSIFLLSCRAETIIENKPTKALLIETKQELTSIANTGSSLEKMQYIEKLADQSPKFHKYCWNNAEDLGGCFIASSMMMVGYNNSQNVLAYFHKVAAQAEDSGIVYRLKVQDLTTNKILLDKKFSYSSELEGYEKNYKKLDDIEAVYNLNSSQIKKDLENFLVEPTLFTFQYVPYVKEVAKISIGFSVTQVSATFGVNPPQKVMALKNLVIKEQNKLLFKQNYSGGSFCTECVYPFFLLEPLVQIELPSKQKILVFGLLAYDVLSPNTLFFQVVGIP